MLVLSDSQIAEIGQIISDYHTAFFINLFGAGEVVSEETRQRLVSLGLIHEQARLLSEDAVMFGLLLDKIQRSLEGSNREEALANLKSMSYDEFKKFVVGQLPQPLTNSEKAAIEHVRGETYTYIKDMSDKVTKRTDDILDNEDAELRSRLAQTVQRKLIEGLETRKTISQIGRRLAEATKDYAKDWYRVSATEVNNAYLEGKLQQILDHNKGTPATDIHVYKRPSPGACQECVSAYLHTDGTPKVFKLSDMSSMGNNIGKKRSDRNPVVGSLHPWCRCELYELLPGFGFDKDGNDTYVGVEE